MTTDTNFEQTIAYLETIGPDTFKVDDANRLRLIDAAQALLARIVTPYERSWQLAVTDATVHAARRTLDDLGMWEGWLKSGVEEASLDDLAGFCNAPCDHELLREYFRIESHTPLPLPHPPAFPCPGGASLGSPGGLI